MVQVVHSVDVNMSCLFSPERSCTTIRKPEQGMLLIITHFDKTVKRVTEQTAQIRNEPIIYLVDQITFGYAIKSGKIEAPLTGVEKPINQMVLSSTH